MKKHPFAALIYSIEKTLGLRTKARPNEEASKASFDSHRKELQNVVLSKTDHENCLPRLEKIIRCLHIGCNLPSEMMSNHFDIVENIYTAIARQPNVFDVFYDEPLENYINHALIPLVCVDIHIFKMHANEHSIYYHLDRLLFMENLVSLDGDTQKLNKNTAQRYMREYIQHHFEKHSEILKKTNLSNASLLMPELLSYLGEFYKKGNQTCAKLHDKLEFCSERLSRENIDTSLFSIQPIISAYTAIIILQDIANKTGMIAHLYNTYNILIEKQDPLLDDLHSSVHAALSENYDNIILNESSIYLHDSNTLEIFTSSKRRVYLEKITYHIFELFGFCILSNIEHDLMPLLVAESYLGKMISLPPKFCIPMDIIDGGASSDTKDSLFEAHTLIFNNVNVKSITKLMHDEPNKLKKFFMQYIPLIEALDCIKRNEPDAALNIINNVQHESLPLFGFIKHSLAVLKVGLMLRLKREEVKHMSLMPQVNDIINHQGIVLIPIIPSFHVSIENDISWLSEVEYIEHSLIFGGNTYNSIIAQAIYCYNFTIARHTTHYNLLTDYADQGMMKANLKDINYASALINHDLLTRLNTISGNILAALKEIHFDVKPDIFVRDLIRGKHISMTDVTDNLIHCVAGSSLGVCLLDYLSIIFFFSVPGDNVENIIALGKKTKVVELLFRYQHPLHPVTK
ncbi:hypothetical protein G4923_07675 [Aeromonas rivipollensis]|jgi:hypothetical protein|uniref:Uncharacterized protein n=1 Tax=Aeromonas rivipollensis TaxID=948519 RepID=A0ABX0D583_9GAMM|nr:MULTISPECIES: hypothetical protein [Aeromonas]MCE9925477.1 hypothetical protein [Aeromonas media]NEX88582.1 hypothetical protein [Aeromonas rivipollensis]NEY05473.1 hypothetical protein [Aeromonas rivipollensis]